MFCALFSFANIVNVGLITKYKLKIISLAVIICYGCGTPENIKLMQMKRKSLICETETA